MGKYEKLLAKILNNISDNNIDFDSLCKLLVKLGFNQRIKGDNFIFTKEEIPEIINIQPINSKAKAYQTN